MATAGSDRAATGNDVDGAEIADRCILLMLNEACRTLDEQIIDSPRSADLALVMGTGFAPFRGGLLRYADEAGIAALRDRLGELAGRLGSRFEPATLLSQMADTGETFYPDNWPHE